MCPVNDLISKFVFFIKLSQGCELTENCTFTGILKWWVTLKIKIEEASAFRLTFLSIIMILIHVVFFLCLPGITWYYIKDLLFLAQLIHKKCSILFCFIYCNTELETIDTQNNVQSWSYLHMQRGRDRNIYRHIITVTVYKHNFLLSLPIKQCSTAEILIVKRELWTRSCQFY